MNFYDYFESVPVFLCALAVVPCAAYVIWDAIDFFINDYTIRESVCILSERSEESIHTGHSLKPFLKLQFINLCRTLQTSAVS